MNRFLSPHVNHHGGEIQMMINIPYDEFDTIEWFEKYNECPVCGTPLIKIIDGLFSMSINKLTHKNGYITVIVDDVISNPYSSIDTGSSGINVDFVARCPKCDFMISLNTVDLSDDEPIIMMVTGVPISKYIEAIKAQFSEAK